jgi:hypothetical protein
MDNDDAKKLVEKEMDPIMKKCVEDCARCYKACTETLKHCTEMGGVHVETNHLMLLKDCAEICKASEDFMLRGSMHSKCLCDECAKICDLCAESCEAVDPNDPVMKECAKICRECAASCRSMPA